METAGRINTSGEPAMVVENTPQQQQQQICPDRTKQSDTCYRERAQGRRAENSSLRWTLWIWVIPADVV